MKAGPPRSLPKAITGRDEAAPAMLLARAARGSQNQLTTAKAVIALRDVSESFSPSLLFFNGRRMVTWSGEE